jgi:hypothetical protein
MSTKVGFTLLLASLAAAGSVTADTSNVSTGLDESYNLLTTSGAQDAHWTYTDGTSSGAAEVVTSESPDWWPAWLADGPDSSWIEITPNYWNGPAPYSFSTTFDLTGYDVSSASLSGGWTVDDAGTLSLNGHVISTLGSFLWGQLNSFSAPNAYFVPGVNTLTMTITYADTYDGARLEGALTAVRLCGNGVIDPLEQCDDGSLNGTPETCCDTTCHFKLAGTTCDDGNTCTQTDQCNSSGACVGSNPVVCTAQDPCHVPGMCNPATGTCSNPTFDPIAAVLADPTNLPTDEQAVQCLFFELEHGQVPMVP